MESSRDAAAVSSQWMDGLNQQVPEIKATTMVDDRRLYAFRVLGEAIAYIKKFDKYVGKKFNSKKLTVAQASHERETSGIPAVARKAKEP